MKPLYLYYPYRPFLVFQKFAENKACSNPDTTGVVSENSDGTCPSGKVKLYPLLGMKGHTGLDLHAPDGVILRSPIAGIVKEVQLEPERGLGVGIISSEKKDMGVHGQHYAKVRQWHGKKILVQLGQEVKIGDPVMWADNTGLSAGSHNHFELKPVEYQDNGGHYNVSQDNGYYGSIDPLPFFVGTYAEDFYKVPPASITISIFAAELEAKGNTVASKQLYALAALLRAFGY